jgi:hypothetical protein
MDWAQHNPMVRHLQTRFRTARIAVDILLARDAHDVPRSFVVKSELASTG